MKKEDELKHIQKKILVTSIIGVPGAILVGLGLYGKFGANGDAFLPILNDQNYVNGFIVAGGIIMLWEMVTVFKLARRKVELISKKNA